MSWFRGSASESQESAPKEDTAVLEPVRAAKAAGTGFDESRRQASGPWDVTELNSLDSYVDLGAIWLKAREGMEVRLDVDTNSEVITSITVVISGSAVQLQAFAAPRSGGIWEEVRGEIAEGIRKSGSSVDEVPGPFGYELIAQLPARDAQGKTVTRPARFVGIEGSRWFLRAVFHGKAAYDESAAADLESFVRDIAIVRGPDPMAPRDMLSLRAPRMAKDDDAVAEGNETPTPKVGDFNPFERGPEITEVR